MYVWLLAAIFLGISLHAPLSVGLGTLWPDAALLIKAWKEILMGVALVLIVVILTTKKQWGIVQSWLMYLIAAYTGVMLILVPLLFMGIDATASALLINLRFLLFFVLVYVAVRLYPRVVPLFLSTLATGAVIVIVFGVLQVTILPHDVLKYIGYGPTTIMPYLTVDQNMDFIRISSTLRGPNPLGAYMAIVLAVLAAAWGVLQLKGYAWKWQGWLLAVAGALSALVLWASYSRSALVAAVIAIAIVGVVRLGSRVSRAGWVGIAVAALVLVGGAYALRDTSFVSTVILHEDPAEGGVVNSNDEHAASFMYGFQRLLAQPFGAGVGSTGSPSLVTDAPLIIENQYFYVAHEAGWAGLVLFLAISVLVLWLLWRRRRHWLGVAVFASGVGLMIAGMVLPVWADDTVAIIWWGLAAIALAVPYSGAVARTARFKGVDYV